MKEDWHLNKTVTVGNILAVTMAVIALIGSYYTLDKRITVIENAQVDAVIHMSEESIARKEDVTRVCARLDRIEDLIMRVILKDADK